MHPSNPHAFCTDFRIFGCHMSIVSQSSLQRDDPSAMPNMVAADKQARPRSLVKVKRGKCRNPGTTKSAGGNSGCERSASAVAHHHQQSFHTHSHDHQHGDHSHDHNHSGHQSHSRKKDKSDKPGDFDMDKLRSTLKQFVRDWSEEVSESAVQYIDSELTLYLLG